MCLYLPGSSRCSLHCVEDVLCCELLQVLLDTLDIGKRLCDMPGKDWGDVEEGGVPKPSKVLA